MATKSSSRSTSTAAKKESAAQKEHNAALKAKQDATDPAALDEAEKNLDQADAKVAKAQAEQAKSPVAKKVAKEIDEDSFASEAHAIAVREKIPYQEAAMRLKVAEARQEAKQKTAPKNTEPKNAEPGSVEPVGPLAAEFEVNGDQVMINGEWMDLDSAERSIETLRLAAEAARNNRAASYVQGAA